MALPFGWVWWGVASRPGPTEGNVFAHAFFSTRARSRRKETALCQCDGAITLTALRMFGLFTRGRSWVLTWIHVWERSSDFSFFCITQFTPSKSANIGGSFAIQNDELIPLKSLLIRQGLVGRKTSKVMENLTLRKIKDFRVRLLGITKAPSVTQPNQRSTTGSSPSDPLPFVFFPLANLP